VDCRAFHALGFRDLQKIEEIKKIALKAMFSDDEFMELLVLKGGNAMDIIHKISSRASIDLDFSIKDDFEDLSIIEKKTVKLIKDNFAEEGYIAYDIYFKKRPQDTSDNLKSFWGGYEITFKIIEKNKYHNLFKTSDIDSIRRNSIVIGPKQKKIFKIDISKYEYCSNKKKYDLDGYTIYCYSPEMILFEKLRAICQQTEEYSRKFKTTRTPRARDFIDIFTIMDSQFIDIESKENILMIKEMFKVKKVPLSLLKKLRKDFEFHLIDFPSVKDTVKPDYDLKDFEYYFEYVLDVFENINI